MRALRRFLGRASLLLLLGAALYLYSAHQAGRAELRALCEQGVEPKVYRRVSAEGYFDGGISCLRKGCWDVLTKSGFRYIEVEQRDAQPWDALSENGYYRLSKVRQESGLCDTKILEEMKNASGLRSFVAEGNCIRKEKIEVPTAAYGIFRENIGPILLENWFGSQIDNYRFFIKEMNSESLVAEQNSYVLFQNSLPAFSSFRPILHCYSRGIGARARADVSNVEVYVNPD